METDGNTEKLWSYLFADLGRYAGYHWLFLVQVNDQYMLLSIDIILISIESINCSTMVTYYTYTVFAKATIPKQSGSAFGTPG